MEFDAPILRFECQSSIKMWIVRCIFFNRSSWIQAIKDAGIDLDGFLTVGVSAALRQLLEFGLFHGDPHPGNIFAMRDGRIAYVDFGNVAVLSQVIIFCWFWKNNGIIIVCFYYFVIFPKLYVGVSISSSSRISCYDPYYILNMFIKTFLSSLSFFIFCLCCVGRFGVEHRPRLVVQNY